MKDFVRSLYPTLMDLQKHVNSFVEDLMDRVQSEGGASGSERFVPRAFIVQDRTSVKACVELPGVRESDLEISASSSGFRIRGRKPDYPVEPDSMIMISESAAGSFEREFTFPSPVDENGVEVSFKMGVLSLTFPRKGGVEKEYRNIPVPEE